MRRLININTFKKIFSISKYRRKLDKIILDFYGLSLKKVTQKKTCENDDEVTILIIVMINTEVILKIIVKDVYNVLNQSKTFYINFSFREVCKSHELIIPCYWEIYIPYCLKNLKENPKICLIAALLYCTKTEEIELILRQLKMFNKKDIENIIKIIL